MKHSSSTTHNYFLAQTKSLQYQLRITQLKLFKLQSLNKSLEEQLHLKDLEIFRLNSKIQKLEQKPKHVKFLKARVQQLQKDFQLEIQSVIKNTQIKTNISNQKFNSTLPFGDSFSESSRASKTTFNIQKLQRNSIGNQLDVLEEAFNSEFSSSDDLKNILFKFIKNIHQGCNLVVLIDNSKVLFEEMNNYLKNINKFAGVHQMFMEFLAESKEIFSEEGENSDNQ